MSNTAVSKSLRTHEGAQAEAQMNECVRELVELCANNDTVVFELGCLLVRLGGIPRNYRRRQSSGAE